MRREGMRASPVPSWLGASRAEEPTGPSGVCSASAARGWCSVIPPPMPASLTSFMMIRSSSCFDLLSPMAFTSSKKSFERWLPLISAVVRAPVMLR